MNKYLRYGIALLLVVPIFALFAITIALTAFVIVPTLIAMVVMIIAGDGDKAEKTFDTMFEYLPMVLLVEWLMNIQERWIK